MARGKLIQERLMAYVRNHPNSEFDVYSVARHLDETVTRVQAGMRKLMDKDDDIAIVTQGRVWKYTPTPAVTMNDVPSPAGFQASMESELPVNVPTPEGAFHSWVRDSSPEAMRVHERRQLRPENQPKPGAPTGVRAAFATPHRMFQEVGATEAGDVVLRCENGDMWVANRL